MSTLLAELKNQKGKKMQSKNALSNLKNRYVAVLKKCALLNVFGTLAVATMLASPFMASEALAADNPAGTTINSMNASASDYGVFGSALNTPILNNYGNIIGGAIYNTEFFDFTIGMFGYSTENIGYIFNNSGTINISGTADFVYGMSASASDGSHSLTNSGTIKLSGNDDVNGIYASGLEGNHILSNSGTIKLSGNNRVYGMSAYAFDKGNHKITNSGTIDLSGNGSVYGMIIYGTNVDNGIHLLNNTGVITAKATAGSAFEAYGISDYSVGTWATTLRTWNSSDSVFGGGLSCNLTFQNSTLILRPGTEAQGFEYGKEYDVAGANGMVAGIQGTVDGTIQQAIAEVPFLKATLTSKDPSVAKVRLDTNINKDTTPGDTTVQGNLAVVQGQMSNITRKLLQTKYTEIYIDLVSDNGNSGIAAGSEMAENKWTAFLTPYGSYTNNSEYNFDGSQMGVTGGASYNFSEKFSLGAHFDFNYAELDADIMDMDSDSTSFAFGLHANYNIMPQWYVSAQATGSISQIENEYSLTTGTSTKADYDSQALYFALNSGYVFEVAKGHTLTPQIGFSYLNMHTDAYDVDWATGYSMYDMEYDSTSYSAFYADVAFNWHSVWQLENNSAISLLASVGLRQNLSGSDIESDFRLLGGDYSTRTSADDTTFTASIGTQWTKNNFSISAEYNGEYGSEQQIHGGSIEFKYHF